MSNNTILIATIALLIGGISGYGLNAISNGEGGSGMMKPELVGEAVPVGMHRMPDGSLMRNDGGMDSMHDMNGGGHMMNMMVVSERAFIEGMIPHHEEAIATAKEVLARGATTLTIRTLAENIIAAQEAEIADMKAWYEDWYGIPYQNVNEYEPMMRDLRALSGTELDRTFLSDMIMHHMGAIMMAHSVQSHIEHKEIEELATAIITTQSAEIDEMRAMLGGL